MLRLLKRQHAQGEESLSIRHLVDDLYVKELRDGKQIAVYDFSLSRKTKEEEITSDGLLKDLAALSTAGFVEVNGHNPHVSLTSRGLELASQMRLPEQLENALFGTPSMDKAPSEKRRIPLRKRIATFLDYLTYV
jgi:hypothetical protein